MVENKSLKDSELTYEILEEIYDDNLTEIAELQQQIKELKASNTKISKRMKLEAANIRKWQEETAK